MLHSTSVTKLFIQNNLSKLHQQDLLLARAVLAHPEIEAADRASAMNLNM